VTTKDGYILQLYRIPGGKNSTAINPKPVLLQHGFISSSETWVFHYENKTYSYYLANHGYDVWLGSNRGSSPSRSHVKYNPDKDVEFWNFSYHEMGVYDLPAMIDYIKNVTGKSKITYFGHSQGSAQIFLGMSLNPEYYHNSINGIVALGPMTKLANVKFGLVNLVAKWRAEKLLQLLGIYRFMSFFHTLDTIEDTVCQYLPFICKKVMDFVADAKRSCSFCGLFPVETSAKDGIHLLQNIRTKKFGQFDYESKNMEIYGQELPPEYDLTRIKNKICLFVGKDDVLATTDDNREFNDILKKIGYSTGYFELDKIDHTGFFTTENFDYNEQVMNCVSEFEK